MAHAENAEARRVQPFQGMPLSHWNRFSATLWQEIVGNVFLGLNAKAGADARSDGARLNCLKYLNYLNIGT